MTRALASISAEAAGALHGESLFHEARLLVLLAAFTSPGQEFRSLSKLAKLDFLLRFPTMAERLLPGGTVFPLATAPTADERLAVESRMVRYKYGPFDDRYPPLLGALVGKGLAVFAGRSAPLRIVLTPAGRAAADSIAADPVWSPIAGRATILKIHFDVSGEQLKTAISASLAEHVDAPVGNGT